MHQLVHIYFLALLFFPELWWLHWEKAFRSVTDCVQKWVSLCVPSLRRLKILDSSPFACWNKILCVQPLGCKIMGTWDSAHNWEVNEDAPSLCIMSHHRHHLLSLSVLLIPSPLLATSSQPAPASRTSAPQSGMHAQCGSARIPLAVAKAKANPG